MEGEGQAIQRVARIVRYDRPVVGLPCWLPFFKPIENVAWAMRTGITSREVLTPVFQMGHVGRKIM